MLIFVAKSGEFLTIDEQDMGVGRCIPHARGGLPELLNPLKIREHRFEEWKVEVVMDALL